MIKKRGQRKKKRKYASGKHFSTKMNKEFVYRSSWELNYMMKLDVDPAVESYEYEPFRIVYLANAKGKLSNYYPDFLVTYVDGRKVLIEIKPSTMLQKKKNVKKLAAAEQWCAEHGASLEVLTERELLP